jgi:hypothetical protein
MRQRVSHAAGLADGLKLCWSGATQPQSEDLQELANTRLPESKSPLYGGPRAAKPIGAAFAGLMHSMLAFCKHASSNHYPRRSRESPR